MLEPSTPDCEHGYRAAGGTYDCPACEDPMPELSTPPDSGSLRCAAVNWDMRDEHYRAPACEALIGDLLWNPKGGDGHVLVAEVRCGTEYNGRTVDCGCGGWGQPCPSTTLVCECGEDGSWRDHHYEILARAKQCH